jgi:sulfite reductase (NADPH) flavoprotein alpha-component
MLADGNAGRLWEMARPEADGGLGASFYVCGRAGFAASVRDAVKEILYRFATGAEEDRRHEAAQGLFWLIGQGRYLQEIFTTYSGPQAAQPTVYDSSEVVLHNGDEQGYWLSINGRVYDVSEFAFMHPGGPKIVRSYAGMDATAAYLKVGHDSDPGIHAMLGMHEIGVVRRLDFGGAWRAAITPAGLRPVTLKEIYRAWIRLLYTAVEMENALANDYGVRLEPVTYDEGPEAVGESPYKIRLLLQTHRRFVLEYLTTLVGPQLEDLWATTSGLDTESHHIRWMRHAVAAASGSAAAQTAARLDPEIAAEMSRLTRLGVVPDPLALRRWSAYSRGVEREDRRFMAEFKSVLRTGLQVFERWQSKTITQGHADLVAAMQSLPGLLERYWARVAALEELR